ncbi:N-formylglutamate amidohydrolase [Candidatus Pacearchaeota archaeon]|nr:N-formylglutamate amidohydrolase [Candidatus Pacearchaeota archaeon]
MVKNIKLKNLLVVIPHSGIKIPRELKEKLSSHINELISSETDWYTDLIYDFRNILGNKQIVFSYNQVVINACRHPRILDDCVPVSINQISIYKKDIVLDLRKELVNKYLLPFYSKIKKIKKSFILDGHSFIKGVKDNKGKLLEDDIILTNLVKSEFDPVEGLKTCPDKYLEFYYQELKKRLPDLKIGVNSAYQTVYDHILSENSWDGLGEKNGRVPIIHQETNESLYIKHGKPIKKEVNQLRKSFAEALYKTMKEFDLL